MGQEKNKGVFLEDRKHVQNPKAEKGDAFEELEVQEHSESGALVRISSPEWLPLPHHPPPEAQEHPEPFLATVPVPRRPPPATPAWDTPCRPPCVP